ncbi:MAG: glycoside hydrolase family 108 protein [Pigmentiphaga sp.]
MKEHFEAAICHTLQWEGEYVDDPHDSGGETNYGISRKAYPDLDIKALTLDQAREIYRRDYWDAVGLGMIRHKRLAVKVFDLGVNVGPKRAVRWLQTAYNLVAQGPPLAIDGTVGPVTARAINAYGHEAALIAAVKYFACHHYVSLSRHRFLAGWLNRLEG